MARSRSARLSSILTCLLAIFFLTAPLGRPAQAGEQGTVRPLKIDKRLIAYWNFDEEFETQCLDASGNGNHATPRRQDAGLTRTVGPFGGALKMSGRHKLSVPGRPKFEGLKNLSISAWIMPTALDEKYSGIFRKEDGENRVLFALQEQGTILALGLNVGGYIECDAQVDPDVLLDGGWHHAAATFDGQSMRVYLDGREVGSLKRPGTIAAGGGAAGCIGSANGGEAFQGAIDELRIHADALTPEEVVRLTRNGCDALARMSEHFDADEPKLEVRPVAHWTFNERGAACIIHEASGDEALKVDTGRSLARPRGVHGNSVELRKEHALTVAIGPRVAGVEQIAISAWTRPTDLRGNREIFRQECGQRLLFSFQDNGQVLSFGLNVDGYAECDAKINPKLLLDGRWHHCAATFDGHVMRVYLDGREIGSLERSGKLATRADVPAFVGSSSGKGEHFQGELDDLRVYGCSLSAEQVGQLHQRGSDALAERVREFEKKVDGFCAPGESFAATLAAMRKKLMESRVRLNREFSAALLSRLQKSFPEDYERFVAYTDSGPLAYLGARGNEFNLRAAERLVGLALEYRPLTEYQKSKQTAEDKTKWRKAEAIEKRLEALKARGESAQFSSQWIEIMLAAGRDVQFRPMKSEPVAPYVTPETPPVTRLSAEEAREALRRDWLHQADRKVTPERIKSEIGWAGELADRFSGNFPGRVDFSKQLAALAKLGERAKSIEGDPTELYFAVRRVKRSIMFANPLIDFDKLLLVDMPYPQGREWHHETRHRLGYMAVPGGRLMVIEGLGPDALPRQLMPQAPLHGSFWRPDLSFDGKRVVFCFKPHNEKAFHLYEINVDGSGLVQLTDGRFDDFDPIYLPDEHIVFSTTRGHTYVRCMPPTSAFVLARCDRDGKNVYLISRNNEPDYLPSVMNDGRIIYTRWEYTDKPLWRAQGLWTVNPDGTQVNTFWGNQTVWPDLLKDVRSIPGSRRVMFTGSAHHNWFSGSVGIIDPDGGFNFPNGLTKVTADTAWPESGNGPVDPIESARYHASGRYAGYFSPYPLGEEDFLVSADRGGKFVLYLMDVDGNRELVYEGTNNIFHALPLRPRTRPPVIADRVVWPERKDRDKPKSGVIYSANVYFGAPAELKDKARFLRVLNIEHKTYTYWHKRPYLSTGPVVSAVQSEGVKRVIGTVPIEADGSVAFHVPTGKPLHFQLLDADYRALQTMRSFTGVMPGERRGCLGCHESHSTTPQRDVASIALKKPPRQITPPPWGEDTVSYVRYVQPMLDKYCGKCHQGDGEGRKKLDLTFRPGWLIFNEPYLTLIGRPSWGKPYQKPKNPPPGFGIADMIMVEAYDQRDPVAYQTPQPMTHLSYRSRLIEIASSGKHNEVKFDPVDLRKLIAWVDTMCPYRGDAEVRAIDDPQFPGVDWLSVRPKIKTAPRIIRPGPVD